VRDGKRAPHRPALKGHIPSESVIVAAHPACRRKPNESRIVPVVVPNAMLSVINDIGTV
jgi:hypothetical protein